MLSGPLGVRARMAMECMTSLGSLLQCCLQRLGIPRVLGVKDEIQKQISKYSLQGDLESHWRVPERAHAKERLKLMCSRHGALKGTLCDTCLFLYPLPPLRKDDTSAFVTMKVLVTMTVQHEPQNISDNDV